MTDKDVISVQNVTKTFLLPHEKFTGLKQAVIHFQPGKKYETQTVLHNVSFGIKEGEFFGIVGRNGSGKSTLLKLLARIYTPNEGTVQINGSLTPFIELGVGFNPELTGRENVFLNGALLGFDRKEMAAMYDDIVEFAELSQFMDQKLKNYSSGMQVRLAFSIAIRAKSDILLIDEVLAVGDASFQQKCFDYFENLKREKRTIVFVTHDMGAVRQFCDRAALIFQGKVKHIGDPFEIAREYDKLNFANETDAPATPAKGELQETQVRVFGSKGKPKTNFEYGEPLILEAEWPSGYKVKNLGFIIYKGNECIFATNSFNQKVTIKANTARLKITPRLGDGRYRITSGLFGETGNETIGVGADKDILIYGQPQKGEKGDEWLGVTYVDNQWE